MATPHDARDATGSPRDLEAAAAETREPERATEIRRDDDARTQDRQADLANRQREAQEALAESRTTLKRTGAGLEEREGELARSAADVERVARDASALSEETADTRRMTDDADPT